MFGRWGLLSKLKNVLDRRESISLKYLIKDVENMQELVKINNDTMTSLQIAEITGKEHYNIMVDIRKESEILEAAGVEHQLKFQLIYHEDSYGRKQPCYNLSKSGVLQLAAKYDAVTRAKLIDLVEQAQQNKSQSLMNLIADPATMIAVLQALQTERETVLLLTDTVETQKPLVAGYNTFLNAEGTLTFEEFAKTVSDSLEKPIGRNSLFKLMRNRGAITAQNKPLQYMIEKGYMTEKVNVWEDLEGEKHTNVQPLITTKGAEYILDRLVKLGDLQLKNTSLAC